MTSFTELRWFPEPLTRALQAAFVPAAEEFAKTADAVAPARSIHVSAKIAGTSASIEASPPGGFFEKGTRPHTETPRGQAMRLRDGSFVRGPIPNPGMAAQPFLRPLLPEFAAMYRRVAAAAMRLVHGF